MAYFSRDKEIRVTTMRFALPMLILSFAISSCSRTEERDSTFTLSTGVTLIEAENCGAEKNKKPPSAMKENNSYLISMRGYFSCEATFDKLFLTTEDEKNSTLVLGSSKKSPLSFNSSCECARSLTVRLTDRLEKGDTVYLLYEQEVLGHVTLP